MIYILQPAGFWSTIGGNLVKGTVTREDATFSVRFKLQPTHDPEWLFEWWRQCDVRACRIIQPQIPAVQFMMWPQNVTTVEDPAWGTMIEGLLYAQQPPSRFDSPIISADLAAMTERGARPPSVPLTVGQVIHIADPVSGSAARMETNSIPELRPVRRALQLEDDDEH